jgi:hypothetical protein
MARRSETDQVMLALAALRLAETRAEYRGAKALVGKLKPATQLAMVDAMIAARERVGF